MRLKAITMVASESLLAFSGDFKSDAIYYPISWLSGKSKRSVKSVPAAEILAASEGIHEENMKANTYSELLGLKIQLCFDSKDFFTLLSTQKNPIDR